MEIALQKSWSSLLETWSGDADEQREKQMVRLAYLGETPGGNGALAAGGCPCWAHCPMRGQACWASAWPSRAIR